MVCLDPRYCYWASRQTYIRMLAETEAVSHAGFRPSKPRIENLYFFFFCSSNKIMPKSLLHQVYPIRNCSLRAGHIIQYNAGSTIDIDI